MSNVAFRFPSVVVITVGAIAGANLLSSTPAQLTVTTLTGGNNIIYNPGTVVTDGSFIVGVTYQIASMGTTNWTTVGAPANATIGTKFTAIAASGGAGGGTASVAVDSCRLNFGSGLPSDVYIASQASGTAGGVGVYNLATINSPTIPTVGTVAGMTQGQHFTSAVSGTASLPISNDGPVATAIIHQNAADTGSTASNYIQGSVDGSNWFSLSSALATTTAAPANGYQSYTSANMIAANLFRLLVGTVTGTANIGGALRSIYPNRQL